METIQDGHQTKEVRSLCQIKGIVCLPHRIAETDTDTHYVYFVRRSLSYVAFCIDF